MAIALLLASLVYLGLTLYAHKVKASNAGVFGILAVLTSLGALVVGGIK